jgi:hypothetical protein
MPGDGSWQLNEAHATLQCGSFRASIDATKPSHGLHDVSIAEQRFANCRFLGIAIDGAGTLSDLYQRGGDLIARYGQTSDRPFAVVAYWRAGWTGAGDHPYVDLIVSVETNLLDSQPRLEAQTSLAIPASEVACNGTSHCCRARLPHSAVSYIEIAHPDDSLTPSLAHHGGEVRLTTRLFGLPLEKGVILRSRLRGLFVPQADDKAQADAAVAEFAAAPPPLTT